MFKQQKHKRFNYKPRFQDGELKSSKTEELEAQWSGIRQNSKRQGRMLFFVPALIVILLLVFGLLYYLERF